jgi:thioredoxin
VELAKDPKNKLIVVDFFAEWCGPCKQIEPFVNELATKYRHVTFLRIDVDQMQETSKRVGITAMPTFQFYKAGSKVGELKGSNPAGLEQLVKQHQGPVDESSVVGAHSDLVDFITMNQIECLNEKKGTSVRNIFKRDATLLESDVDEQLLMSISFNQDVKIHSIRVLGPSDKGPKTIKTYVNRSSTLGFDEADSVAETEMLNISKKDLEGGEVIPLKFVRYQAVHNINIFIVDNQDGEETTQVTQLIFYGTPTIGTNMKDLKKQNQHE